MAGWPGQHKVRDWQRKVSDAASLLNSKFRDTELPKGWPDVGSLFLNTTVRMGSCWALWNAPATCWLFRSSNLGRNYVPCNLACFFIFSWYWTGSISCKPKVSKRKLTQDKILVKPLLDGLIKKQCRNEYFQTFYACSPEPKDVTFTTFHTGTWCLVLSRLHIASDCGHPCIATHSTKQFTAHHT